MKIRSKISRREFVGSTLSAAAMQSLHVQPFLRPMIEGRPADPGGKDEGILNVDKSPYAKLHSVPVHAVTIDEGFWSKRRATNVERSIPTMRQELEEHGRMVGHVLSDDDRAEFFIQVFSEALPDVEEFEGGVHHFAVADFDEDGLDDAASLHPSIFYVLKGTTGRDLIAKDASWESVPAKPVYWGQPVACRFAGSGPAAIFFGGTGGKTERGACGDEQGRRRQKDEALHAGRPVPGIHGSIPLLCKATIPSAGERGLLIS